MKGIKAEDPRRDGEKTTMILLPTLATDRTIIAADDSRSTTIPALMVKPVYCGFFSFKMMPMAQGISIRTREVIIPL